MTSGNEIKGLIVTAGVKMWEVAAEYGITPESFSRKLRTGFNEAETEKVKQIVERLKSA